MTTPEDQCRAAFEAFTRGQDNSEASWVIWQAASNAARWRNPDEPPKVTGQIVILDWSGDIAVVDVTETGYEYELGPADPEEWQGWMWKEDLVGKPAPVAP